MACNCDSTPLYTCGTTIDVITGSNSNQNLVHVRNHKTSFMLGATEILVNKVTRNFNISHSGGWSFSPTFALSNEGATVPCGGSRTSTKTHSVSESYECVNTTIYFLDMRYNNAICKEVTEILTFSEASSATATFQTTWGQIVYPKYVITNHIVTTITKYFIVLNGIVTILKTNTIFTEVNDVNNPLILVWPNPPSLAIPWGDCADILQYGFYDYYAVGEGEGQEKIRHDGGDDFYFTDWMRNIGNPTLEQDQADAEARYFEYYLGDAYTPTRSYSNPGLLIDSSPVGSIAQDKDGNIFYSIELDGEIFNSLTGGNLPTIFTDLGPNQKFFPIGLV